MAGTGIFGGGRCQQTRHFRRDCEQLIEQSERLVDITGGAGGVHLFPKLDLARGWLARGRDLDRLGADRIQLGKQLVNRQLTMVNSVEAFHLGMRIIFLIFWGDHAILLLALEGAVFPDTEMNPPASRWRVFCFSGCGECRALPCAGCAPRRAGCRASRSCGRSRRHQRYRRR